MTIEATLAERGKRYGKFADHAAIAQNMQDVMRNTSGWAKLAADQKQALTVIADKVARMLNGDPAYLDNWHDIIGYARLVETRMIESQTPVLSPKKK
jgi:hypothetical protein